MDLKQISTKELSDELRERLGVQSIELNLSEKAKITTDIHRNFSFDGPAVILVNMD